MRWLSVFMAIVVLLLAVQPVCGVVPESGTCCSIELCNDAAPAGTTTDDHHRKECNSVCNPFQSCGCCAFSIVVPPIFVFYSYEIVTTPRIQWGIWHEGHTNAPPADCLKPPRLA